MDEPSNVPLLVSIGGGIASIITFISFWMKLSDRITEAKGMAEDAIQDAAEAKQENDNLRELLTDMIRGMEDRMDRAIKAYGEGLAALRQNSQDQAFFVRDNFVLKDDFKADMKELKDGQSRLNEKFDKVLDHLRTGSQKLQN